MTRFPIRACTALVYALDTTCASTVDEISRCPAAVPYAVPFRCLQRPCLAGQDAPSRFCLCRELWWVDVALSLR